MDDGGHFSYAIESVGQRPIFTTEDPAAAAQELSKLGVEHPDPLLAHARNWGSLEIVERRPSDQQE